VKKFKAEPIKYIKTELTCPVMGETVDKEVSTVYDGVKYYFCCAPCVKKFEKDPQKYLNKSN
jgi:YHS domain-containing protein